MSVAEQGAEPELPALVTHFFPSSFHSAPFVNSGSSLCYLYAERGAYFLSFGGSGYVSAERGEGKGRGKELCLSTWG